MKQVSYSFFAHSKNSAIRCSTFLPFFCHFPGQISHPDCISWRNLIVNFTVWAGPWMQYSISQDSQKFKLLALRKLRQTHFLEAPLKPNITSHTHTLKGLRDYLPLYICKVSFLSWFFQLKVYLRVYESIYAFYQPNSQNTQP